MFELVFIACLVDNPSVCKEHSLTFMGGTYKQCSMYFSQSELTKWLAQNPGYVFKTFKCRGVSRDFADI